MLQEIENLDTLTALEELWLGKNKITEIKGVSHLSNLRIISLPSNRLTNLEGLSSLTELTDIYLSHNQIQSLAPLAANKSLRVIDISSNQITSLTGVGPLTSLEEFWASDNQIEDFAEIDKELKDKKELATVYFEGNPLQKRQPALYRNKVRLALPQLKQIDASKCTCFLHSSIVLDVPGELMPIRSAYVRV